MVAERCWNLNVLVCDPDEKSMRRLRGYLHEHRDVGSVAVVDSVKSAKRLIQQESWDVVYIDILADDRWQCADFIFAIRRKRPATVFVLYVRGHFARAAHAQADRSDHSFFSGERSRLVHYYTLDKDTSDATFGAAVQGSIDDCLIDLTLSGRESM
jgi:hypothetical protein